MSVKISKIIIIEAVIEKELNDVMYNYACNCVDVSLDFFLLFVHCNVLFIHVSHIPLFFAFKCKSFAGNCQFQQLPTDDVLHLIWFELFCVLCFSYYCVQLYLESVSPITPLLMIRNKGIDNPKQGKSYICINSVYIYFQIFPFYGIKFCGMLV